MKTLHHVKLTSCTPCGSCIYVKCCDELYFEPPQMNMEDDAAERILDQVLTTETICRQHLANKIPIKLPTLEQWREYNNAKNWSGNTAMPRTGRLWVIRIHNDGVRTYFVVVDQSYFQLTSYIQSKLNQSS